MFRWVAKALVLQIVEIVRLPIVLLILGSAACNDSDIDSDEILTCQSNQRIPIAPSRALDILVVLDSSQSLSDYEPALRQLTTDLVNTLDNFGVGYPSLELAVIDAHQADGPPFVDASACLSESIPFAFNHPHPWFRCGDPQNDRCGTSNLPGELDVALDCMIDIERAGAGGPQALEAAVRALAPEVSGNVGFGREHAYLAILFISPRDDASTGPVGEYVDQLLQSRDNSNRVLLGAIGGDDSPRLQSAIELAGGEFVGTESEDWSRVLPIPADFFVEPLGVPCLRPTALVADIQPQSPGIQLSCTAEFGDSEGRRIGVPYCEMLTTERPHPETTLPCLWIKEAGNACELAPILEVGPISPFPASLELACESTCEQERD